MAPTHLYPIDRENAQLQRISLETSKAMGLCVYTESNRLVRAEDYEVNLEILSAISAHEIAPTVVALSLSEAVTASHAILILQKSRTHM